MGVSMKEKQRRVDARISLKEYLSDIRDADIKFHEERDRRYTEVKNAEEKALKIKEEADKVALDLARQIQTYKDEQHNGLLKQHADFVAQAVTQQELKAMADKVDITMRPLTDFVSSQQGRVSGADRSWQFILGTVAMAGIILSLIITLMN
jgi:hypothetical protein